MGFGGGGVHSSRCVSQDHLRPTTVTNRNRNKLRTTCLSCSSVSENPEDLGAEAVHKQALRRILEPSFNKVLFYLRALTLSVDEDAGFLPRSKATEDQCAVLVTRKLRRHRQIMGLLTTWMF